MSDEAVVAADVTFGTFRTSASTAKLDAALAKAQGEIELAAKNAENPGFKRDNKSSRYADLAAVVTACKAALSKNGVARSQWPTHSTDNRLHLVTRLACEGEWMLSEFSIPVSKADAQGYGSAMTYAKRFGLAAAVGVAATEEDDDGADATTPEETVRMSEKALADHLAAIETATDMERLQKANSHAVTAAGKDQMSLARIIAAKTKTYKALLAQGQTAAAK